MSVFALLLDPDLYDSVNTLGRYPVPEEKLKKRLGKTNWDVWISLCRFRCKETGMMHALRSNVANHQGHTSRQVARAIRVLIKSGLVVDYKRQEIPVKVTDRRTKKTRTARIRVPLKIVYGVRAVNQTGDIVLVPPFTATWLSKPRGWGGFRERSGRPKKLIEHSGKEENVLMEHSIEEKQADFEGVKKIKMGSIPPSEKNQDGFTEVTNNKYIDTMTPEVFINKNLVRESAQISSEKKSQEQVSENIPAKALEAKPVTNPVEEKELPGVGLIVKGSGTFHRVPLAGLDGVPRYPGVSVVPPAMVPNPPLLPENVTGKDSVLWLLKAYRGAIESRYKKRCFVLAKGDVTKSKYYRLLLEAANTLRDMEMSPAAWITWSVDFWRQYVERPSFPGLAWVFSQKRMADREGWFKHEDGCYSDSRAIYNDYAVELLNRYSKMQGELRRVGTSNPIAVSEVVQRWFPGNFYAELVQQARDRSAEDQRLMNQQVKRGEYIW